MDNINELMKKLILLDDEASALSKIYSESDYITHMEIEMFRQNMDYAFKVLSDSKSRLRRIARAA